MKTYELKYITIEKLQKLQEAISTLDNLKEPCRITLSDIDDEIPELTELAIELAQINTRRAEIISFLTEYPI